MSLSKTIALSALTTLALSLSTAQVNAEPTAAAPAKPAAEHHAPPAVKVTLEDLKKRPKTKLKIAKSDTVLYVADLHCAHCAKNVSSKLYTVKGVVKVRTDIKADVAIISPQSKKKLDPLALWKAADKSGFPALKLVGPAGTYVRDSKTKQIVRLADKKPAPAKS
ncbi:MAG: heavy-metal-associated domain-containing protein [Bythopirellula sp.]